MADGQPKIVQVPNMGNIQFPASMSDSDIADAIQKNYASNKEDLQYKPTIFTDDKGNAVNVPHSQTQAAMQKGWKVGPPQAQKYGGRANANQPDPQWTANAPIQNLALGLASGAGIPESEHPVKDLAKSFTAPNEDLARQREAAAQYDPANDPEVSPEMRQWYREHPNPKPGGVQMPSLAVAPIRAISK